MRTSRVIVAGDLAAFLAFSVFGLASHEHDLSAATFARTFLPFAGSWLLIGAATGMFRPTSDGRPVTGLRLLGAFLMAGVIALVARSIVFDRTLLNAFFVIALVGNGLLLFGWRTGYNWWLGRRSTSSHIKEAPQT
jgi:Protein of unknown function (DUF3054)